MRESAGMEDCNMESLYERCMKVMPPVVKRATTMGVTKGEGCYLWSEDGRKILDFASGVAVCNLGHNHPKVVEAVEKQMKDGKCPKEYFEQFENIFHTLIDPSMVAAIMMEPVQGEGGYIVPDKEFVQYVREICDKYGILLIFDEVQSGMGRTGKLFAYEHFGVKPDILTSAKGIANGFPLSAVIGKKEIMEQWPAGAHGGTFGGNPVACAAANAVLDELTDGGMLDNAAKMGDYFKEKLFTLQKKYPSVIGDVRGLGLMLAMEMVHPDKTPDADITTAIRTKALEKGLLLLGCGTNHNIVRFIAPTIVTEKEIDIAINIIDECLKELTE